MLISNKIKKLIKAKKGRLLKYIGRAMPSKGNILNLFL